MALARIDDPRKIGINQYCVNPSNFDVCRYCGRKMKWSEQWHQYICQHCGSQSPIGVVKVDNI